MDEPGWPSDRIPAPTLPGADRSAVLAGLNGLVSAGRAEWRTLPRGATMVRLATGQCFRLDDEASPSRAVHQA